MLFDEDEDINQLKEWLNFYKSTDNEIIKKHLCSLIVLSCSDLVKKVANGMASKIHTSKEDLIQVGYVGLLKAIDFYKPTISTRFKTYANYFIIGEIKHYLRDKNNIIKPPRKIQELAFKVNSTIQTLIAENIDPSIENIAHRLNLKPKQIEEVIEIDNIKNTLSLDQEYNSGSEVVKLSDKIPSEDYQDFLETYEEKIMIKSALSKLQPNLKDIVKMHFFDGLNQKQIATKLDLSQMQVSRLLKKSLKNLYDIIKDDFKNLVE